MPSVELPFWLVVEAKHVLKPPVHEPCDDPGAAHGFTAAIKLADFMRARGAARWEINQIADPESVIVAVAELYGQGITEICVDPDPDGSGGLTVSLADLLNAYGK